MPSFLEFDSKQKVLEYWRDLVREEGSSASPPVDQPLTLRISPNVRYVVSPATPSDAQGLAELAEDFVRSQRSLFAEQYRDVAHKTWCEYLGVYSDVQKRQQYLTDGARNLADRSRNSRFSMAWCNTGWTLKCEQQLTLGRCASAGSKDAGIVSPNSLESTTASEPSVSRRLLREDSAMSTLSTASGMSLQSSRSSRGKPGGAAAKTSAGSSLSSSQLVGYIHFSLQEGTPAGPARCSKRLKRKRGECTGEYIKVHQLLVGNSHRGEGLGALLLTAALAKVRRHDPAYAREMFLTVIEKNINAVGLYQRLGFRVMGKNNTHLGKVKSLPVSWLQMILEHGRELPSADESAEDHSTTASSGISVQRVQPGRRVRAKVA
eukprot:TRINITY_DN92467_c0_g1_i1.p1 TRINITY_DN92467_c0_g1~~TRINITY_DN92467_c0_g1_i1.p1  ORF type:complete len:377 (+),score=61.91 TRINITY_DN92467_c0_g1_i1:92-1222(+)